MSWYDALEAGELTVRPSVDAAKRFGMSIDRMSVSASAGTPLAEVLAAVEKSTADVIVLRYPARETTWFAALASGPRQALLADTVVCWSLPVGKGRRPAAEAVRTVAEIGVPTFYAGNAFISASIRQRIPGIFLGDSLRDAARLVEAVLIG